MGKVYVNANDLETDANTLFQLAYEKAYTKGQEDAWEYARKLVHPDRGGLSIEAKIAICGKPDSDYILLEYSAKDAITKIKEYESRCEDNKSCTTCVHFKHLNDRSINYCDIDMLHEDSCQEHDTWSPLSQKVDAHRDNSSDTDFNHSIEDIKTVLKCLTYRNDGTITISQEHLAQIIHILERWDNE